MISWELPSSDGAKRRARRTGTNGPGQLLPVELEDWFGVRRMIEMIWGLTRKDAPSSDPRPIEARSETITMIRRFASLLSLRRCLVHVGGWYESRREGRGNQPYYVTSKDQPLLTLAALYTAWRDRIGDVQGSYCLITAQAPAALSILNHRMPVILRPEEAEIWISKGIIRLDPIIQLLHPYDGDDLVWWPVHRAVHRTEGTGWELIRPHLDGAELRGMLPKNFPGTLAPRQMSLSGWDGLVASPWHGDSF